MPFVIKPIQPEDLDTIYPDSEAENIARFTHPKKFYPIKEYQLRWAVDESRKIFLTQLVQASRDSGFWTPYLFGYEGFIVILAMKAYCEFEYLYISPQLKNDLAQIEPLMREAFQFSGVWIDGVTDKNTTDAVPNAQFLPYVAKGE